MSLLSTRGKYFSFHFKCYNLTIRVVKFCEFFCTCSLSSLGQDPMVKKNLFGLLELEMANLECFFEKNGLGPLGV
jgi:hypothetical protein